MKNYLIPIGLLVLGITIYSFDFNKDKVDGRWYSKEQVSLGKEVFLKNCASCHGQKAEKTVEWKKTLADGSYPAPPLNDKAHAWHHPKWQLMQIIDNGGAAYGGKMPGFKDTLTNTEKEATIAYFQTFWGDEFYNLWKDKRKGLEDKK